MILFDDDAPEMTPVEKASVLILAVALAAAVVLLGLAAWDSEVLR